MTGNDRQYLMAQLAESDTDSDHQGHWNGDSSATATGTDTSLTSQSNVLQHRRSGDDSQDTQSCSHTCVVI